jgi:hypothetical protein
MREDMNSLLLVDGDTRRALSPSGGGYEGTSTAAPHPVYTAGLKDVLAGTLPASALLTGWRYILLDGDRASAAAEVTPGQDGEEARLKGLSMGPFVGGTVRAVAVAERLKEVRESDYELRLLNIPGLYVVALWLHGRGDIFIPLRPAPSGVKPYSVYSAEGLTEALRESAERRASTEGLF